MASSKEYLNFVLDQMSEIQGISYRAMMGEYVLYFNGKVFGGVFDDRFLVKPVPSARKLMPEDYFEIPYNGGKEMLLVDNIDDKAFLAELIEAMYDELPETKKKRRKLQTLKKRRHFQSADRDGIYERHRSPEGCIYVCKVGWR